MPKRQSISEALPASLHEAIETERDNLAKAESLLGCLAIAMECESESATGPYYPDVAQIAREMVRRSINGLDSLALDRVRLRNKVKEDHPARFALAPCYTALAYGSLTYDAASTDHR